MHVAIDYSSHLLLLLVLPWLDHVKAETDYGSACTLKHGYGVCLLITECRSAYNNLLQGTRPEKTCGYDGLTPIVCCPDRREITGMTTSRPFWVRPNPPNARLYTNRPASQMCAHYARSVFTIEKPPRQSPIIPLIPMTIIVGGEEAEPGEFPHMASIGYNTGSKIHWDCGGTLISETFILTAAHCTISPQWGEAQWVRVGDLNLYSTIDNAQPQDRWIIQRIRHPNYRKPAKYNDIALLRLQQPVVFTAYVRPACLDVYGNHPAGQKAVASGWGLVDWSENFGSEILRKVDMPIAAHLTCASFYTDVSSKLPNGLDDQSQLCAGGNVCRDTCQGDSGGPLVVNSTTLAKMYDLIGITSFGQSCGSTSPGVYTRVFHYLPWIESIVWPNLN